MLILAKDSAGTQPLQATEYFTGDGSTTEFTFQQLNASDVTEVRFFNLDSPEGVVVDSSNYTLDTTNGKITFTTAPGYYTDNFTATDGQTTYTPTKQPLLSVASITKNGTALTTSDYTVDTTSGTITFSTALAAGDAMVVVYRSQTIIMCLTSGSPMFADYAVLPNSTNVLDRTMVAPYYVVETGDYDYNSVSIDITDTLSGSGASADWFTLSLDGTNFQPSPLMIGHVTKSASTQFWVKVVVPQQAINIDLRDVVINLGGIALA